MNSLAEAVIILEERGVQDSEDMRLMHEALLGDVSEILDNRDRFDNQDWKIGGEWEYHLLETENGDYKPVSHNTKDLIAQRVQADEEFGASMIELKAGPLEVDEANPGVFNHLYCAAHDNQNSLVLAAADEGVKVLKSGDNPYLTPENFEKSEGERYEIFSDILQTLQDERTRDFLPETFGETNVDPRNIDLSGMIAAFQPNIQSQGLDDAAQKANYLYAVQPYVVAALGNAKELAGQETGFEDFRMPLWQIAADIRNEGEIREGEAPRVGELSSYYDGIEDYLDRMSAQTLFSGTDPKGHKALKEGEKQYWKDVKIKFDLEDYVPIVEARAVSSQSSLEGDIDAARFLTGRLAYAQIVHQNRFGGPESLPDIGDVNWNRKAAAFNGMKSQMYDFDGNLADPKEILEDELYKAREGLENLGVYKSYNNRMDDATRDNPLFSNSSREFVDVYSRGAGW